MNGYCRLSALKTRLGVTGTTLDAEYVTAIEEISREWDGECLRPMFAQFATRYMDTRSPASARLLLGQDLASITTLKFDDDGDYSYGLTLAANTDYWTWPETGPIRALELNGESPNLTAWAPGRRRVQIAGLWGYSYELEDTTLTVNEAGGDGSALDTSETAITVSASAAALLDAGETIVIDSEQMYVTAVSTVTLTVVRAINGTTAATHANAAAVYRRRYPRDVEAAVKNRVAARRWDNQSGFAGSDPEQNRDGGVEWYRALKRYRLLVAA